MFFFDCVRQTMSKHVDMRLNINDQCGKYGLSVSHNDDGGGEKPKWNSRVHPPTPERPEWLGWGTAGPNIS